MAGASSSECDVVVELRLVCVGELKAMMMMTTMRVLLVGSITLLGLWMGSAAAAAASTCPGGGSSSTIESCVQPQEDARVVAMDPSGQLFEVGSLDDELKVLHVYGSPFELGRAHGALLKTQIHAMYSKFFRYMEDQVIDYLHLGCLPRLLTRPLARMFVNAALDSTFLLTVGDTPARFVDEMLGLASGAEIEYNDVKRIQMIPELSKAACSILGAWGPATAHGGLYQVRALDWDMNAPILDFHVVIYYHPAEGESFAIFTWAGFIGCITGYSGHVGISEKVWLGYSGSSSRKGMPWHFALRDVLQFTKGVEHAISLLHFIPRTCPLLLGIGSAKKDEFVLVGYSSDTLQIYDDSNFTEVTSASPGKDELPGVVYVDKFVQPSTDMSMGSFVHRNYGALNASTLMEMVAVQQTGDMHAAVYDYQDNVVYFSWAVNDRTTGKVVPAYSRCFLKLDMSSLSPDSRDGRSGSQQQSFVQQ